MANLLPTLLVAWSATLHAQEDYRGAAFALAAAERAESIRGTASLNSANKSYLDVLACLDARGDAEIVSARQEVGRMSLEEILTAVQKHLSGSL